MPRTPEHSRALFLNWRSVELRRSVSFLLEGTGCLYCPVLPHLPTLFFFPFAHSFTRNVTDSYGLILFDLHPCCWVAKSRPTMCVPVSAARQPPWSMGFPGQEYWSQWPFPSPEDLPNPELESMCPALAGGFFTSEPPGKPNLQPTLVVPI